MDTIIATLEVLPEPYRSMATTLVDICAYAGEGNILFPKAVGCPSSSLVIGIFHDFLCSLKVPAMFWKFNTCFTFAQSTTKRRNKWAFCQDTFLVPFCFLHLAPCTSHKFTSITLYLSGRWKERWKEGQRQERRKERWQRERDGKREGKRICTRPVVPTR